MHAVMCQSLKNTEYMQGSRVNYACMSYDYNEESVCVGKIVRPYTNLFQAAIAPLRSHINRFILSSY